MAVKIQQLRIVMQYLPNTSNNPEERDRACVCTAVPIVDSITTAVLYSCCICYSYLIILKKRMDICDIVKVEGKKQQVGLFI
jgi:hypothetical protein